MRVDSTVLYVVSVLLTRATKALPKECLFHCFSGDSLAEGGSNQWEKNLITLGTVQLFLICAFSKKKKKIAFWPPPVGSGCLNKGISWSLPEYYSEWKCWSAVHLQGLMYCLRYRGRLVNICLKTNKWMHCVQGSFIVNILFLVLCGKSDVLLKTWNN